MQTQVVDEIYNQVTYATPFIPSTRSPSSCFCLLYKIFTMQVSKHRMPLELVPSALSIRLLFTVFHTQASKHRMPSVLVSSSSCICWQCKIFTVLSNKRRMSLGVLPSLSCLRLVYRISKRRIPVFWFYPGPAKLPVKKSLLRSMHLVCGIAIVVLVYRIFTEQSSSLCACLLASCITACK